MLIPIPAPARPAGRRSWWSGSTRFGCSTTATAASSSWSAGRSAPAIANAQAYEEERRRAEALAELDRAKTAFFSNVSHEFRTPLTLMLGPLEDAARRARAGARRARAARRHPPNALRLLKLVNSLLDFSRIEAGGSRRRTSRSTWRRSPPIWPASSARRSSGPGCVWWWTARRCAEPVYVDRDMWEKIVLNLLSNALKFTFEGEIGVALRAEDGRGAS